MATAHRKLMDQGSTPVTIEMTADPAGVAHVSSVVTYSSQSIGSVTSNRIIVLAVNSDKATAEPLSATIDYGTGAQAMSSTTTANVGGIYSKIFYLAAPSGTTATFAITFFAGSNPSGSQNKVTIFKVAGASATPATSGTDSGLNIGTTPLTTGSITIPTSGGFIGVATGANQGNTFTWTNATEVTDGNGGNFQYTTASRTTSGTVTITCASSSSNEDGVLSYIVFNPA